jgi:hypothetical protein
MQQEYRVESFVPAVKGCGAQDNGWDPERCRQFQDFLNQCSRDGWRLHSSEYRQVTSTGGCGNTRGAWLVCIFERERR